MGKVISDSLRQLNLDFDKSHCDHVSINNARRGNNIILYRAYCLFTDS
jgi:hypothetical protein